MHSTQIKRLSDWQQTLLFPRTSIHVNPAYKETDIVDVARTLWLQEDDDFEHARSHKWGGYVVKGTWKEQNQSIFFKHFKIHSPRHIHKPSRARHTFEFEEVLRKFGFRTAEPLALIEKRFAGIAIESALLFKEIPNSFHTYQFINQPEYGIKDDLARRRNLVRALGIEIGKFHSHGFFHGDMHTGNIFTQPAGDTFKFYWIDNEEGQAFGSLPWRKRVNDLDHSNRLNYSVPARDFLRFLDGYCGEVNFDKAQRRRLWEAVEKKSARFRNRRGR